MHFLTLLVPILVAPALSAPEPYIEERHIISLEKRQADLGQLLQLAQLAGISSFPTDPAVLLSLGPLASQLAAQLPTSSVLNVLVTAAPSGFLSSIINDPSYANAFASDFAKGSSPSWFNALPTDVKSYLHTYSGFTGVASAAQAVQTGVLSASGSGSMSGMMSGSGSMSGSSGSSMPVTTSGEGLTTGADTQSTSAPGQGGNADQTSTSTAGAPRATGVIAAGVIGAMGVLGLVGL